MEGGTYLSVVLQPFGSDFRDGVVLLWLALRDSGQLQGVALTHGSEQVGVNVFLETCGLLYKISG